MNRRRQSRALMIGVIPQGFVRAVLRNGVYRRTLKPGRVIPFRDYTPGLERLGPLIDTRPQHYNLLFTEIYSADRIPLNILLSISYAFDPGRLSSKKGAGDILLLSDEARRHIVYTQVLRVLRELVGGYVAESLYVNPAAAGLERDIYIRIYRYLKDRGIMIGEPEALTVLEVHYTHGDPEIAPTPPPKRKTRIKPPEVPPLKYLEELRRKAKEKEGEVGQPEKVEEVEEAEPAAEPALALESEPITEADQPTVAEAPVLAERPDDTPETPPKRRWRPSVLRRFWRRGDSRKSE